MDGSCVFLLIMTGFAGTTGSPVAEGQRDLGYSTLIAFPRVGRSTSQEVSNGYYYGQKREGKPSGLIPFPRVGRSGKAQKAFPAGNGEQREPRPPLAQWIVESRNPRTSNKKRNKELTRKKRQTLIPFPRVGKRESSSGYSPIYVNGGNGGAAQRITRSNNDRITRGHLLRMGKRRLLRMGKRGNPVLRMGKRQTLIPFPRTGKRSNISPSAEMNQYYVYDDQKQDDSANQPEEVLDDEEINNEMESFRGDDIVGLGESSSGLPSFKMSPYRDSNSGFGDMEDYDLYRYEDSQ